MAAVVKFSGFESWFDDLITQIVLELRFGIGGASMYGWKINDQDKNSHETSNATVGSTDLS